MSEHSQMTGDVRAQVPRTDWSRSTHATRVGEGRIAGTAPATTLAVCAPAAWSAMPAINQQSLTTSTASTAPDRRPQATGSLVDPARLHLTPGLRSARAGR